MKKFSAGPTAILILLAAGLAFAALSPLPSGTGLAAAYTDDNGIAANPAVLFADNFEGYSGASISWTDIGGWGNVYGTLKISRSASEVHAGNQCVRVDHTSSLGTHGAEKEVAGFDTLFVRFYMKFASNFPGVHHAGMGIRGGPTGELFSNHTGSKPNGTNFFTCYLDHLSPLHGWQPIEDSVPPGWVYDYCYHMDQSSDYGDVLTSRGTVNNTYPFSTDFVSRPNVTPQRNRWTCYEIMVQANTIGQQNGRVALWVDGALIADHPGLRFRTVNDIKARYIALSTYSSGYVAGQTLWYDDIVIAKSYIGPMKTGNSVEVRSPGLLRKGRIAFTTYDIRGRKIRCFEGDNDPKAGFFPAEKGLWAGINVWVIHQGHVRKTVKKVVLK